MSFPSYESYKGSGLEWLGDVPSHWKAARLKSVLTEPLKYGANEAADGDDPDQPRFVRITDIDGGGRLRDDTFRSLPLEVAEPYLLSDGDLLFARSGATVGKSFIYRSSWGQCCYAGYLIRARASEAHMLADFLYHCCQSDFYWQYVGADQIQSTIQNFSAEKYANLWLPVPPLAEQVAITAFLERVTAQIDELVEAQRRLIELLKEKRQAVISHLVTKGLDPSAPMKDSGVEWLGHVPAHWEVTRLKFVAHIQTGVAKGKDNGDVETVQVPYLRVANVQDGWIDLDDVATIELPIGDVERYRLRAGDVLMNEGGDFDKLGRGGIWRGEVDPCVHQNHVFSVRPFAVSAEWLDLTTSSDAAQFFFKGRSKQSTNLASISSTNLMELPILVPPSGEQTAIVHRIVEQCRGLDALVDQASQAVDLLTERRAALISAAVTGKIDVRDIAAAEAKAA